MAVVGPIGEQPPAYPVGIGEGLAVQRCQGGWVVIRRDDHDYRPIPVRVIASEDELRQYLIDHYQALRLDALAELLKEG